MKTVYVDGVTNKNNVFYYRFNYDDYHNDEYNNIELANLIINIKND